MSSRLPKLLSRFSRLRKKRIAGELRNLLPTQKPEENQNFTKEIRKEEFKKATQKPGSIGEAAGTLANAKPVSKLTFSDPVVDEALKKATKSNPKLTEVFNKDVPEKNSIHIASLDNPDYSEFKKQYEEYLKKPEKTFLFVGGPSAKTSALLASIVKKSIAQHFGIETGEEGIKIIHAESKPEQSAAYGSAFQVHTRHSGAIYEDSDYGGHELMIAFIKRFLRADPDEIFRDDFLKINISGFKPHELQVYIENEINHIIQQIKEKFGLKNQHITNREKGILSRFIAEKIQQELNLKILQSKDNEGITKESSIHVCFTEKQDEAIKEANKNKEQLISSRKLSPDEIEQRFPRGKIFSAYAYPKDNSFDFAAFPNMLEKIVEMSGESLEEHTLKKVLVCQKDNETVVAGVVFETQSGEEKFIPTDFLYTSLGPFSEYEFEVQEDDLLNKIKQKVGLLNPTMNTTTSSGASAVLIIKGKMNVDQTAASNSHWTIMSEVEIDGELYSVVKATGGGNTGGDGNIPASYCIKLMLDTIQIFGEENFVGVHSMVSCSRSVNRLNSGIITKLTKNFLAMQGLGGTGITLSFSNGVYALCNLGLQDVLIPYFNKFQLEKQSGIRISTHDLLGNAISEALNLKEKYSPFLQDNTQKTESVFNNNKRFTRKEKIIFASIITIACAFAIKKMIEKSDGHKAKDISKDLASNLEKVNSLIEDITNLQSNEQTANSPEIARLSRQLERTLKTIIPDSDLTHLVRKLIEETDQNKRGDISKDLAELLLKATSTLREAPRPLQQDKMSQTLSELRKTENSERQKLRNKRDIWERENSQIKVREHNPLKNPKNRAH